MSPDRQRGYAKAHVTPGWFVTFEGPEGSGKTIQSERLRDAAVVAGIPSLLTREPGGTPVGDEIRRILMDATTDSVPLGPRTDAFLFNAARAQHVDDVILPGLARGELVICARYADSTIAYQGYGSGLPIDALRDLEHLATDGPAPGPHDPARRARRGRPRPEGRPMSSSASRPASTSPIISGSAKASGRMAADEPERFVMVDATADVSEVAIQIRRAVGRLPGLAAIGLVPAGDSRG